MRIALITDAWHPQVNGVVRTLTTVMGALLQRGHVVQVIAPDQFRNIAAPSYPEIRLALAGAGQVGRKISQFAPDSIHIATEGPLGWAARRHCLREGRAFTTAYHTQFPEYLARRTHLPASAFWPMIRHFHRPAERIMVATRTIRDQLRNQGLDHLHHWSRGVDIDIFHPDHMPPDIYFTLPRPIQLYVGRVAVEKNIEAFLANRHPGSKVVVGDGPALAKLQARFLQAHFLGPRSGNDLAAYYSGADVLVFPSKTDTFGLVMIEALACGTPVAAYPVPGPLDVLADDSGAMADQIESAIERALLLDRDSCLAHGRSFSWDASADQFLAGLETLREPDRLFQMMAAEALR
ncbi:GDP-mannose-dependent alpha-mannosyltransferase [Aurantiacibacter atlanticus]|uniref:GDP-mannose-dependent alpha-mannosyltransferase n=1 Tax=Aurantiacibacter atlanticus TaxID=1648404 RepID=A0A0H4VE46_9SPHN|nr:glycosyltransferase family 1 protein [Aurantiacibacter atlanticus]AKQ41126.1 GDP-mannose-dependent alpha-mannosyltransferase [Aurantiacibacter atlanticus]MDF1833439.1 glycosyltransferase family 1 protein [Alteraurantiacibacter sp. bin_em_oilr2.035]